MNQAGGVLGRPVEYVLEDAHSDTATSVGLARKLIEKDKVSVVFGCWSSSARKAVAEVCKAGDNLLVYASVYEGLEDEPWVVHAGGAPNQYLRPAAKFAYTELGKRRFFLVGSDYVYSRVANQVLRDNIERLNGQVVGEEYVPLEGTAFRPVVEKLKRAGADVVFNTVDGDSNTYLFRALRAGGVKPADVPTMWLAIGEEEMSGLRLKDMVGDYAAMPYFRTVDSPVNRTFLDRLRARFPTKVRVSDASEASYCAVHLWRKAVAAAGTPDPVKVRAAFRGQTFDGPEGTVRIDPDNLHAWRMARIARINEKLEFEIVQTSVKPVEPEPFPASRPRPKWEAYLADLRKMWGGHWEAPPAPHN